jgi:hypothetical protein
VANEHDRSIHSVSIGRDVGAREAESSQQLDEPLLPKLHSGNVAAVKRAFVLLLVGCSPTNDLVDADSAGPDSGVTSQDAETRDGGGLDDAATSTAARAFFAGAPPGAEATDELCTNGLDDDGNGFADCRDFWCTDSSNVTVCGTLENTRASCSDGVDNAERPTGGMSLADGEIDCADRDCLKGHANTGCAPPLAEVSCDNGFDDDRDGASDCADFDCLHASMSSCPLGGRVRVLFDGAHRQRAGSADLIVDMMEPHPWPSQPSDERDWSGSVSAFGFDLLMSGQFVVETLPAATGVISMNDANNPQDLTHFGVLVLLEPSAPLADSELDAMIAFVEAGGGILMVTDHEGADRDGNGWDSVRAFNAFFDRANAAGKSFGLRVENISFETAGQIDMLNRNLVQTIEPGEEMHPVLTGPFGDVTMLSSFRGGIFTVDTSSNASAKTLMHILPLGTMGYERTPYVVVSELGSGRIVAVGDSAIITDGSQSHGPYRADGDNWHTIMRHQRALFMNAVRWLTPD